MLLDATAEVSLEGDPVADKQQSESETKSEPKPELKNSAPVIPPSEPSQDGAATIQASTAVTPPPVQGRSKTLNTIGNDSLEEVGRIVPQVVVILKLGVSFAKFYCMQFCLSINRTYKYNNVFQIEEEGGDQFSIDITVTDPKKIGDGMNAYLAYKVNTKVRTVSFLIC